MKYFYGQFDGSEFPTQDKLFGFDQFMAFIMQYGEQAIKAIEQMLRNPKDDAQSEMLEQMIKEGLLDKDGKGKVRLTPRAVGRMQQRALMEVFANLRIGQREGHEKIMPGAGGERMEGTKSYEYGDPVSELDLHQTLHNALARVRAAQGPGVGGEGSDHSAFRIPHSAFRTFSADPSPPTPDPYPLPRIGLRASPA